MTARAADFGAVITRNRRARYGTWAFHCRAGTIAQDVSSRSADSPAPYTE